MSDQALNALVAIGLGSVVAVLLLVPTAAVRYRRHGRLPPGELVVGKSQVLIGTGTYAVRLGEVKPFGKKQMNVADWARGARLESGIVFGADG